MSKSSTLQTNVLIHFDTSS